MNYTLEKLNSEADLEECATMMSASEPWITLKRDYEKSLYTLNERYADVFIAKNSHELLAFVILRTQGGFVPYLQTICIKEKYRDRGLGSKLIGDIEKIYFEKYPNIFMCVSSFNDRAKKLYLRLGYEVIGELEDYFIKGHSEFILRKSISPVVNFKIKEEPTESEEITISTDKSKLNLDLIHRVLANSYWSPDISKARVATGIKNSLCFGLYKSGKQIGFARVLTDFSRFAYLLDVFIIDVEKGNGYGKLLMKHIMERKELQVDKWLLGSKDAHGLYAKYGFTAIKEPHRLMEKRK